MILVQSQSWPTESGQGCSENVKKSSLRGTDNCEHDNQDDQETYQSATCSISTKETELVRSSTSCSSFFSTDRASEEVREDASHDFQSGSNKSMFVKRSSEDNSFWTEELEEMLTLRRANPVFDSDSLDSLPPNFYIQENHGFDGSLPNQNFLRCMDRTS